MSITEQQCKELLEIEMIVECITEQCKEWLEMEMFCWGSTECKHAKPAVSVSFDHFLK